MSKCIIAGCALIYPDTCVWGDLHQEGNCYIFNACLFPKDGFAGEPGAKRGEAAWQRNNSKPPEMIKQVIMDPAGAAPFERRGVIVFAKASCTLNQAAKDYIK